MKNYPVKSVQLTSLRAIICIENMGYPLIILHEIWIWGTRYPKDMNGDTKEISK